MGSRKYTSAGELLSGLGPVGVKSIAADGTLLSSQSGYFRVPGALDAGGGGGGEPVEKTIVESFSGEIAASQLRNYQYGTRFVVGASDLTVTALRHFSRLAIGPWNLYLWRESDSSLLASAIGITKVDREWSVNEITPVVLQSGGAYRVTALPTSTTGRSYWRLAPGVLATSSDVTISGKTFDAGTGYPDSTASGDPEYILSCDIVYTV